MYISTKTYPNLGSTCFRQWRADSHCNKLHGYSFTFHFEFEAITLDRLNWVVDFGGLKDLENKLKSWFDHTTLVAFDDPLYIEYLNLHDKKLIDVRVFENVGCEALANMIYYYVNEQFLPKLYGDRVWCSKVQISEHERNSAMKIGHRPVYNPDVNENNYGDNQGAGG